MEKYEILFKPSVEKDPIQNPESHKPTPEGMSPKPTIQFLTEVEEILVNNDLI